MMIYTLGTAFYSSFLNMCRLATLYCVILYVGQYGKENREGMLPGLRTTWPWHGLNESRVLTHCRVCWKLVEHPLQSPGRSGRGSVWEIASWMVAKKKKKKTLTYLIDRLAKITEYSKHSYFSSFWEEVCSVFSSWSFHIIVSGYLCIRKI